jgi:hypothetical protein
MNKYTHSFIHTYIHTHIYTYIHAHTASFASSRGFFVDQHHGEALVPLADMFNHKVKAFPTTR